MRSRRYRLALTVLMPALTVVAVLGLGPSPAAAAPATSAPAAGRTASAALAEVTPTAPAELAGQPYLGWSSWSMQSSKYPGLNPKGSFSYLSEANVLKQ